MGRLSSRCILEAHDLSGLTDLQLGGPSPLPDLMCMVLDGPSDLTCRTQCRNELRLQAVGVE